MGNRKANDKPVAPTISKKRYSIAEACAKILDSDYESLLGNFDLSGIDRDYPLYFGTFLTLNHVNINMYRTLCLIRQSLKAR